MMETISNNYKKTKPFDVYKIAQIDDFKETPRFRYILVKCIDSKYSISIPCHLPNGDCIDIVTYNHDDIVEPNMEDEEFGEDELIDNILNSILDEYFY